MIGKSLKPFSSQFIAQVSERISHPQLGTLNQLRDAAQTSTPLSVETFLNTLFARASAEFIRSLSPKHVSEMVIGLLGAVSDLDRQADRISITLNQRDGGAEIFLALDDRPFIISSLAEALSDANIKVTAFLHPILSYQDRFIAVSCIAIDAHSLERTAGLLPKLREMLQQLASVGSDFAAMREITSRTTAEICGETLGTNSGPLPIQEVQDFFRWLNDGCFFFLGAARGSLQGGIEANSLLGILRSENKYIEKLKGEINQDIAALKSLKMRLLIRKSRLCSPVHRHATLLHIAIQPDATKDTVTGLVGYLTSKALAHEAQDVPVLRQKVAAITTEENVIPNSHDFKYIVEVIDNMPTDEALAAPVTDLLNVAKLALGVFSQEETRTLTTFDQAGRRAFTSVVLPPERYSAQVKAEIQALIEETLQAELHSSETHLDSSKRRQFRLYISTPLPEGGPIQIASGQLSKELISATLSWDEKLVGASSKIGTELQPGEIFPADYKVATEIPEALHDLEAMLTLSKENPIRISLFEDSQKKSPPLISILSLDKELSISLATPVLENVGLEVLSAYSYECNGPLGTTHLLKMSVRPYDEQALLSATFNSAVAPGLSAVLRGIAPNDLLNSLLRKVPVNIRQISLVRCYCALLWQVQKVSTKRSMWSALEGAPQVALQLCRIFDWMFNPVHPLTLEERLCRAALEENVLIENLRSVRDISQDRILRALLALVKNTVRTNFYTSTETLALKLRSQRIEFMPPPRPLFEIFVFSPRIEGTHLRSAKVARGGIRWSERIDDYRSEVLGLMKTQRVKNVIIVPSGAKGGFVIKNLPRQGEAMLKAVETGYREYITALLSLADNKVGETVTHPQDVVIHDEADPYFVVAADKGTATFSDIANSIAKNDFNFWLGDAFASGGSAGYDHKKYGITAKGGWECVLRHFRDLGIDYVSQPFSVVGLGDMSGDVFGNALILSRNMALIAAFNHKHIFVDPTPDLSKTFDERVRLFNLPRSQWSDFNPQLISKGGGVFQRFDKEIQITPEMRQALSISDDVPSSVDGEKLITLILQARVDLIWNGGIGTYVKASTESHADVNDGTNDGVRVNADQLRARIVGEGGNLGFTQRARVEFAQRGGRINTDAIDNSGGVDLSDHEVNLKLLLSPLVSSGRIPLSDRDSLLKAIAGDVVELVLQHNREHALMLTASQLRSASSIEGYRFLIREMHRRGFLDRTRDCLPDEAEIDERLSAKTGLTRPELAICSAAIKMWVKEELRGSPLCTDPSLQPVLLNYFPKLVRERFTPEILNHPLRSEIVISEVINSIMPVAGISCIYSITSNNAADVPTAVKCLIAADAILGGSELRQWLSALDTPQHSESFAKVWLAMGGAVREAANWLLITHGATLSLQEILDLYADQFRTLLSHSTQIFTGSELKRFERRVAEYITLGADPRAANSLALYRRILPLLEMLWASRQYNSDVTIVAHTYSQVLEELKVNELFKFEHQLDPTSKWEQELIAGSYQEIRRNISMITGRLTAKRISSPEQVRAELLAQSGFGAIRATMKEIEEHMRQKKQFQIAVLPVITRQLRTLSSHF